MILSLLAMLLRGINLFAGNEEYKGGKGDQMIFTNEEYQNFELALPHAVKEIKDGDKLWMYVKLRKPIGTYLAGSKFTDEDGNVVENIPFTLVCNSSGAGSGKAAEQPVFVKGGEKAPKGQMMNKGFVAYLDGIDVNTSTEFKICLSEYIRRKSSFVFLKVIGGGEAGKWTVDFFLKGKNLDIFLTGNLICNAEAGIPQYRMAWKKYETIVEKGDIADNVMPPTGKFNDEAVRTAIVKDAKTAGTTAERVIFTQDGWQESTSDDVYQTKQRLTHAYVTYKKGDQCFYTMAEVTQKMTATGKYGPSLVRFYLSDTPVLCTMLGK